MSEPDERRLDDRRKKWWVRSPQQWFNIVSLLALFSMELGEYLKQRDVAPSWFLEALALTNFIGNMILRAWKKDNEQLTLSDPKKEN